MSFSGPSALTQARATGVVTLIPGGRRRLWRLAGCRRDGGNLSQFPIRQLRLSGARARARPGSLRTRDLPNVCAANPKHEQMPTTRMWGLVTSFDVSHDTTQPMQVIDATRTAIGTEGPWLCSDICSFSEFAENLP
jgi:hypothetical protein